jgi:hypothetical protein
MQSLEPVKKWHSAMSGIVHSIGLRRPNLSMTLTASSAVMWLMTLKPSAAAKAAMSEKRAGHVDGRRIVGEDVDTADLFSVWFAEGTQAGMTTTQDAFKEESI